MGCGWLGWPLATAMTEAGYTVRGSTTSPDKTESMSAAGIHPFVIRLNESGIDGPISEFLQGTELLVINVPPGLRRGDSENYVMKMHLLYHALKRAAVKEVVFVSSTSVYGSVKGIVAEDTPPAPDTESGRQLLESERLFVQDKSLKTIVVRFGGLIGPNRHPVTRLSGRKGLENGQDPVNLIHLNDCVQLISSVVRDGHWDQVFNGVFPAHPKKADYYTREAVKRQLVPPQYKDSDTKYSAQKVISRNFLAKNYAFFTSIFS